MLPPVVAFLFRPLCTLNVSLFYAYTYVYIVSVSPFFFSRTEHSRSHYPLLPNNNTRYFDYN